MTRSSTRKLYEQGVAKAAKQKRCGQCGKLWEEPACGPTHATVAAKKARTPV